MIIKLLLSIFLMIFATLSTVSAYECDRKTVKGKDFEKEVVIYCGEAKGFSLETINYMSRPETDFVFKYGDKVIHKITNSDYFYVNLEKIFTVKGNKVLLVGLSKGGKICPAVYKFITVAPDGTGKATKEFGTCSDLIETSVKDDTIVVSMPKLSGKGKEVYIYKDGVVTKQGAQRKK